MSAAQRRSRLRTLVQRDGNICVYCHRPFGGRPFGSRSIDHVIPRSRGGSNRLENLALACRACNCAKADRLVEDFLAGAAA